MEFLTKEQAESKTQERVREAIKRYRLLAEHSEILAFVFCAFYVQGGHARFDENLKSSLFEPRLLLNKRVANLVIGVKDRKDHMEIVWSSFHEWGHLSQPPQTEEIRLDPQLTYEREKEAWDIAEVKLKEYPAILPLMTGFYPHRDRCLSDYQSKIPV